MRRQRWPRAVRNERWTGGLVLLALSLASLLLALSREGHAQAPPPPEPTAPAEPPSRALEPLEAVARLLARPESSCRERCFTLARLRISGALDRQPLEFELEGAVNAREAVDVPLFGPPDRVRLEDVTENGKPAAVGFEKDHYYLHTDRRRFALRGKLTLSGELALVIPGPLNTFEAALEGGRVAEGSPLSGLSATSLHFEVGAAEMPRLEPTLFQLARAVRVTKNIEFEYRLSMQSGTDVGLVRLPLLHGEKVLEVGGSTGWRTEGKELVLPTTGRKAELSVTGTLPGLGEFTPDARSPFEWWLFESDPEHRVRVEGTAQQVDAAKSPIERTQPTARLFLVKKGQQLKAAVEALVGNEVLAAIIAQQTRSAILTHRGDVVFDDTLAYENNGIDYLLYAPGGRPIFLATDGKAERLMHREDREAELMIPLRTGQHSARVQALAEARLALLGGRIEIPMPTHPLTATRAEAMVGLPAGVVPLLTLGGDEPDVLIELSGLVAVAIAFAVAWLALRGRGRRLLGGAVLGGLWFVAPWAYVLAVGALAIAASSWLLLRLLGRRVWPLVGLVAAVGALILFVVALQAVAVRPAGLSEDVAYSPAATTAVREQAVSSTGNFMAQSAEGGVLQGVTPVALPLPEYERSVTIRREFVTRDRPFTPVLYYVTGWVAWPLLALWALAAVALGAAHRRELLDAWARLRARLAAGPPTAREAQRGPAPDAADPAALEPPDRSGED